MKTKIKMVIFALCVGALASLASCDKDDGGSDPNVFCDEDLCANSDALKEQCIDAYNACMANEPDANDDECAALALIICGI